jgi:battenin
MVGCLFLGLGTSIGGLVVLGFIKCFPPIIFSGFSSGTGFAGLLGATCYLFLKYCNASFEFVLSFIAFLYPIYFFAFRSLLKCKFENDFKDQQDILIEDKFDSNATNDNSQKENLKTDLTKKEFSVDSESPFESKPKVEDLSDFELHEARINEILSIRNSIDILSFQKIYFFLFFALYFLEYFSITELADRLSSLYQSSSPKPNSSMIFATIQLIYQMGVFVSRSSLDYIQIKNTGKLVFFLFIIVICLFTQFWSQIMLGSFWLYGIFCVVGIFGGLGYSNIMYQVISHPKSEKNKKVNLNRN